MNQALLDKLKDTAKRTIKILELIEQGFSAQEIVEKVGCNRSLVDYYIKRVKNND